MRRTFVSLLGALLFLITGMIPVTARQDAENPFADLGLPELEVTITATGFEGISESLEAGRYVVTATATEDSGEFGAAVAFVQPEGMTAEEFLGGLGGPPEEPAGEALEATPAEGGEEMGGAPPPEYYASTFAGGAGVMPGESTIFVVDLTPGEWIAWGDDPAGSQEPVIFEVTGEMPADLAEPESSATLTMGEYVIGVSEGELVAGPQVLKIENAGAQPHFIASGRATVDVTEADIEAVLEAEMTGTPAAVDFNPDEDFEDSFYTATQSTGTSVWIAVDLEPGTHVLLCFFPDMADGMPHAMHGMYELIEVSE
jgi:hypothetical protein